MSKFAYSFTLRIFESPPYVVSSGPDVPNSTLVIPSLVTLPPLDLTIPREKSVFDQLLEKQENNRIGNRRELDYVAVTAHSPLHRVSGQQTPAWIVTLSCGKLVSSSYRSKGLRWIILDLFDGWC